MPSLKTWLEAFRLKFFVAGIPSVFLGGAAAYFYSGTFDAAALLLTLVGIMAAMVGCYTFNEYYDFKSGVDVIISPADVTPFNAGSRVLPSGLLRPESVFRAGIVAWVLMTAVGTYFTIVRGIPVLILTLAGSIAAAGYTLPPMRWAYRGLGEALIGLSFGPIIAFGSYFVQAGEFTLNFLPASLVPCFLITAVIWINEFPDYKADMLVGKRNLVVRLGLKEAVKVYPLLFVSAYLSLLMGVLVGVVPHTSLVALLTIPLACRAVKVARDKYDSPQELIPAMRDTILTFVLTTLLVAVGYVVGAIWR